MWAQERDICASPSEIKRMPAKRIPLSERLDRLIIPEPNSGCWLWLGAVTGPSKAPYPAIKIRCDGVPKMKKAHRVVYEHLREKIPDGALLCHRCDNTYCVNPDHMFIGSHSDNNNDMLKKGRSFLRGLTRVNLDQKALEFCPSGHPYSGENLYIYRGERHCRTCRRRHDLNHKAKLKIQKG